MNITWFHGVSVTKDGYVHRYRQGEASKLQIIRCKKGKGCPICYPFAERWEDFLLTICHEFRLFWLLDKLTTFMRAIGYA